MSSPVPAPDAPAPPMRPGLGGSPAMWRSLEQLSGTPGFQRFLQAEFPGAARLAPTLDGPGRRRFLKVMAASFALAGLAGCDDGSHEDGRAQEVPYVRNPERIVVGNLLQYASTTMLAGYGTGVLVGTRNGRPIRIDGNAEHPWTRGGTDAFAQASVLGLYDPDRSQAVRYLGRASSWQAFRAATVGPLAVLRADKGAGFRLLTGTVTSPTLIARIAALQAAYPGMLWHSQDSTHGEAGAAGQAAFGRTVQPRFRFDQADTVVSLDGDFLDHGPQQIGQALDWTLARAAAAKGGRLLALHAASSTPSLTSAKADHALTATPDAIASLAAGLLSDLSSPASNPDVSAGGTDPIAVWRARAGAALAASRGRSIVTAGAAQPAGVQEGVHRLNAALGSAGSAVAYTAPVATRAESLASLVDAMHAGQVHTLLMLDTNAVYDAPGDLGFADALNQVELRIHAGPYADETAAASNWHLPLLHPLESWGDARSWDGTVGLIQPTVAPLYGGRSALEVLSLFTDATPREGRDILEQHWRDTWRGSGDDAAVGARWHQALVDGFVPDTAEPEITPRLTPASSAATTPAAGTAAPDARAITVLFRPDPSTWDGAWANNAWLQELPRPLNKVVWDNVVAIPPGLAAREHLVNGDVVALEAGGRRVEGPVWITPGQAPGTATLTLGYGHVPPDLLSTGLGFDAAPLRNAASPMQTAGVTLTKLGRHAGVACTQDHGAMEGHDFIRVQAVGAAPVGDPVYGDPSIGNPGPTAPSIYPDKVYPDGDDNRRAWGMVIDLDSCIGCNACVVACQSENNIPVVGREEVALGRDMHWLRIDRYWEGEAEQPATHFQPVPCMHCEDAPCEVGCPVEATLHDHEGLNLMVYNRCVGTRACSGYCPYKVRHFNYLDYTGGEAPSIQARNNPDVTVRSRGVMEKCTYCVQRIAEARIESDKSLQPIPDGRVKTACQTACPTRAIHFGDLRDQGAEVRAARADARNYALLGELNLRPRTTYLAERGPAAGEG
ncbi:MAG: TAT-variant-translocated molybdopterin oxidoreductase [Janthinobacterium lividum]